VARAEGEATTTPALVVPIAGGEPVIHCVRTFVTAELPDGSVRRIWFLTLQNGVHRVFALRERGIEYVPMLVIDPATSDETNLLLGNWTPERRQQGVSSRPPLLRDFFDDNLTATFEVPRAKMCVRIDVKIEEFQV
jgi:hypothetical protein